MRTPANVTGDLTTIPGLRYMVHRLAKLVEISVTLNSTLDISQLLQLILEAADDLLGCEGSSILLYDHKLGELHFAAATGADPAELAKIPVPLDGSIAGEIFRTKRPYVINEIENDPRHYHKVGEKIKFNYRSLVGVPMKSQDKIVGVLEAINKKDGGFINDDVKLLSVIASQAAVALTNARLVKELKDTYGELDRVDRLKTNFMAIASHELRTPLGIILGYATLLQDSSEQEVSEHAGVVLTTAIKMRSLIEDMTNMNLLQIGKVELKLAPIPIQNILYTAIDDVKLTADAKQQKITLNLPDRQILVGSDSDKLLLVFVNLINNAVQYSPEKSQIIINILLKGKEVWIEVKDKGIGIPKEETEAIFREFYQVEQHLTRKYGGLGLGLSIAKGLTELHKGRIWVESEGVGLGSTFIVALPVVE